MCSIAGHVMAANISGLLPATSTPVIEFGFALLIILGVRFLILVEDLPCFALHSSVHSSAS